MSGPRFTKLDAAWLHMDEPTNRMVINGFFRFAATLDLERLALALGQGFAPYARFRQRVQDSRSFLGRPRWIDDDRFDVMNHVATITIAAPGDEAALARTVEDLVSQPLEPDRPLWKVYLLEGGEGGGCLVLFRLHHCIADGIALLQVLLSMCVADDGATVDAPRAQVGKPWTWWALLPITGPLYALHCLWIGLWLMLRPSDPRTLFRGELGVPKRVAWSQPMPLQEIKALAHAAGCKVNDVLLAAVAGAMRRYADHRERPLAPGCRVRCVVPLNLRPASRARELGNYFALVSPSLPVGVARPDDRLAAIKRAMDKLKRSPEAIVGVMVFRVLGFFGVGVQRWVLGLLASKTSLVVTNVTGPRAKLSFAGQPIEEIMFWVPMAGALGLGFSILSYAGHVKIGVMGDAGLIDDPGVIADAIGEELRALQAAFPRGGAAFDATRADAA